ARSWCLPRLEKILLPTDGAIIGRVRSVLTSHPKLVGALKNRSGADPFVIAAAMEHSLVVVTGEAMGTESRPRIPFVCSEVGVPCISFVELIKSEGWR